MKNIKKFEDYINESYKISDDDYRYFKRNFLDDKGKYVKNIKDNRNKWEKMMLATCKNHWDIGDGGKDFPKEEMKKVISEVLDDYIKKFDKIDSI